MGAWEIQAVKVNKMTHRSNRRLAWLVIVASSAYLLGWSVVTFRGDDMAKQRATVETLRKDAKTAIDAKDWPTAEASLLALKVAKPDGRLWAHRLRGRMFYEREMFPEAQAEYQAAYDLGDHVAGGSVADTIRQIQKGGK